MLRVKCPKCENKLGIDEAHAGGAVKCPTCGTQFRLPAKPPASVPAKPPASVPAKPTAGPAKPVPPGVSAKASPKPPPGVPAKAPTPAAPAAASTAPTAPPKIADDDEDNAPYILQTVEETPAAPEPKFKGRRMIEDEEEEEEEIDEDDEKAVLARKRAKEKERRRRLRKELPPGMDPASILSFVAGQIVLLIVCGILAYAHVGFAYGWCVVGSLITFFGGLWMTSLIKEDGLMTWVMYHFVPGYFLYYLTNNWHRTTYPFLIQLTGTYLLVFGILGLGFDDYRQRVAEQKEKEEKAAEAEKRKQAQPMMMPQNPPGQPQPGQPQPGQPQPGQPGAPGQPPAGKLR